MSNTSDSFAVLIRVAARLARGSYMSALGLASERQASMRTSVMSRHIEDIEELMKQDAVALRDAADTIRRALGSAEGRGKA